MYRKVLTSMFICVVVFLTVSYFWIKKNYTQKISSTRIATSFFPVYVASSNILKDVPVEVVSLYPTNTGCVHDLSFATDQLVALNSSKLLIINGAGMEENFLDKISTDIKIIDASQNIQLIKSLSSLQDSKSSHSTSHHKDEISQHSPSTDTGSSPSSKSGTNETDHKHFVHENEYNPHYWLSITNYMKQVTNIQNGLKAFERLSLYKTQIDKNSFSYLDRLSQLQKDSIKKLASVSKYKLYFLDDSFKYFVSDLRVHAVFIPFSSHAKSYSPASLSNVLKLIKQEHISKLFVSSDTDPSLISTLSKDSGVQVFSLSLLNSFDQATGIDANIMINSYIQGYQANVDTIVKAYNL